MRTTIINQLKKYLKIMSNKRICYKKTIRNKFKIRKSLVDTRIKFNFPQKKLSN